jgi:hypothetical protein
MEEGTLGALSCTTSSTPYGWGHKYDRTGMGHHFPEQVKANIKTAKCKIPEYSVT